jgi:hypothetical protein
VLCCFGEKYLAVDPFFTLSGNSHFWRTAICYSVIGASIRHADCVVCHFPLVHRRKKSGCGSFRHWVYWSIDWSFVFRY